MQKIVIFCLSFLLVACAYSPQQIQIDPQFTVAGETFGEGRIVAVSAEDRRSSPVIGKRGGVYSETSIITLAENFPEVLATSAEQALQQLGFVVNANEVPAASIIVVLEDLSYTKNRSEFLPAIDLNLSLLLKIIVANKTFEGRYKSQANQPFILNPSVEKNQRLINGALSDTLQRAFSDSKVKAFLSNS